jgi:hypothetical protein
MLCLLLAPPPPPSTPPPQAISAAQEGTDPASWVPAARQAAGGGGVRQASMHQRFDASLAVGRGWHLPSGWLPLLRAVAALFRRGQAGAPEAGAG